MVDYHYVKRGNKLYGPYYYRSYRVGNKVKKQYLGKVNPDAEKKISSPPFSSRKLFSIVAVSSFVVLLLALFFLNPFSFTGKAVLGIEYVALSPGEILAGNFTLQLRSGELLPADSIIRVQAGEDIHELLFSEMIVYSQAPLSEYTGEFYSETGNLSGTGAGYGFPGTKISYPDVFFSLSKTKISELTSPEPEVPAEEINMSDAAEEILRETGLADISSEKEESIEGSVNALLPFSLELQEGETVSLVSGSVHTADMKLADDAITLGHTENTYRITTLYTEESEGFGSEFLGEENILALDLSGLNVSFADEGKYSFVVSIEYQGEELARAEGEVHVLPAENETVPEDVLPLPPENASNASAVSETEVQHAAVLGQSVKWSRTISLASAGNASVAIPRWAQNVQVTKIVKPSGFSLSASEEVPANADILPSAEEIIVDIQDTASEYIVAYETPAPEKAEQDITLYRKQIEIFTPYEDLHYEDIAASTQIAELVPVGRESGIVLFKVVNGTRIAVDFTASDTNSNGFLDTLQWTVSHLSNESYEASIAIINVQSYPTLGGNWTVFFNATGNADLTITAINGTTWNEESTLCGGEQCELRFENLTCGVSQVNHIWNENSVDGSNNSVFYSNYSCSQLGSEISIVLKKNKHYLKFQFGNDTAYAFNDVGTAAIIHVAIAPVFPGSNATLNCSGNYSDVNVSQGNVSVAWYNASTLFASTTKYYIENGSSVSFELRTFANGRAENQSDGFSTASFGSLQPEGFTYNGSDFWTVDQNDDFVYHFKPDGLGGVTNFSDGFSVTAGGGVGVGVPQSITTNGTDFWIVDSSDDFVYHVRIYSNGSKVNFTDGFKTTAAGSDDPIGIVTNGSDFWFTDMTDDFVYHVKPDGAGSITNYSDGFSSLPFDPSGTVEGITTNGSDFWLADNNANFIYHVNWTAGVGKATNNSDGFTPAGAGAYVENGIASNIVGYDSSRWNVPTDFWIADYTNGFAYHFKGESGIQAQGETWNCTINGTSSVGGAGAPNSTTAVILASAPSISQLAISPVEPLLNSALNCSGNYSDPQGDTGNVTLSWYNGSSSNQFLTKTFYNVLNGSALSLELRTWMNGLPENMSDGFSVSAVGLGNPGNMFYNGTDFWILDWNLADDFVYHVRKYPNGSLVNFTDGFSVNTAAGIGSQSPHGLASNGTDFWITDSTDLFMYHVNPYGNGSAQNFSDGFKLNTGVGLATPNGTAYNGSDFWIIDSSDNFVYHVRGYPNGSVVNFTDGFASSASPGYGSGGGRQIVTNGSDFWNIDDNDAFVYHVNWTSGVGKATNKTDGFKTTGFGLDSEDGLGIDIHSYDSSRWGMITEMWLTDSADDFIYHLKGEKAIQAFGETWNCSMSATDASGNAGNQNSTSRNMTFNSYVSINSPANASVAKNATRMLNITAYNSYNEQSNVYIYAANDTKFLNTSLVYSNFSVNNGTEILYNLTALPIQKYAGDGLIALFHFDNRSEYGENDSDVLDFSWQRINITVNETPVGRARWNVSGGKFGGAFEFSGVNHTMTVGNLTDLEPASAITLAAWIHAKSSLTCGDAGCSDPAKAIISRAKTGSPWFVYDISLLYDREVQFRIANSSVATNRIVVYNASSSLLNEWHHVAGTYNGSSIILYIDGVQVNSTSAIGNIDYTSDRTTKIGTWSRTDNFFNGSIDEVAIWNRSLSEAEVAALYNLSLQKYFWRVNVTDGIAENRSTTYEFTVQSNQAPAFSLNRPANSSTIVNTTVNLSVTVSDSENDAITTVYIYAANDTKFLNTSQVYVNMSSTANGTDISYNLTALPIQKYAGDGLVVLYHFDNRSEFGENDTTPLDFSWQGNNGSARNITGATCAIATDACPLWNVSGGKFGGAFEFDGEGDYMIIDDIDLTAFTFSAWVNMKNISNNYQPFIGKLGSYAFTLGGGAGASYLRLYLNDGGSAEFTAASAPLSLNTWTHIAATFNGSYWAVYKDGQFVDSQTLSFVPADTAFNTFVGMYDAAEGNGLNGTIDEVAIWNRSLSAAEVANLYSLANQTYYWKVNASDGNMENASTTATFRISSDAVNPSANILAPGNNHNRTSNYNVTFSCNATDDTALANVSLYGNWSGAWHFADSNNTWYAWQNSTQYNWNITLSNDYENRSDGFSAALFGGSVVYGITTNGSDFWISDDTDNFIYHVRPYGNGSVVNFSDGFNTGGFGEGIPYSIASNNSDFWTIGNDDFLYHVRPYTNGSITNFTDGFSMSALGGANALALTTNGSDFWLADHADNFVYHVKPYGNGSGQNFSDGFKVHTFGSQTAFGITTNGTDFWIYDTEDNFTYHIHSFQNGTAENMSDGFSISDFEGFGSNGGNGMAMLPPSNDPSQAGPPSDFWFVEDSDSFIYHVNASRHGQFVWNCLAADAQSNVNWSNQGNYTLTVDANAPEVSLVAPVNGSTNSTGTNIDFTYNATDIFGIANCTLYLNGVANNTNTTVLSGVNSTIRVIGLPTNAYQWTVKCYDSLNNANSTGNYTLTSDVNFAPYMIINYPANATSFNNITLRLNATVYDSNTLANNITKVDIYVANNTKFLNTSMVYTNLSVKNATEILYNLTALPIQKYPGDGLVLLYHFDNRSEFGESYTDGATVYDFSRMGNNGSLDISGSGTGWNVSGGKFGGGFANDGLDDGVLVGSDTLLNFSRSTPFTLSAWVMPYNYNTEFSSIFHHSTWNGDWHGIWMRISSGSIVYLQLVNTSFYYGGNVQSGSLGFGTMYHVVGTYNTTQLEMYINGQLVDSQPVNFTGDFAVNAGWGIGSRQSSTLYENVNGTFDEVAIWNRSLSALEVANLYNLTNQTYYWRVNVSDGIAENTSTTNQFALQWGRKIVNLNSTLDLVDAETESVSYENTPLEGTRNVILKNGSTKLAFLTINFSSSSSDFDWTGVAAEVNISEPRTLVHIPENRTEVLSKRMFVHAKKGTQIIYICPNATSMSDVNESCPAKRLETAANISGYYNVSIDYSGGGETNVTNCLNITVSGSYLLNTSITNSAYLVCMNISVSDVSFECEGNNNFIDGAKTASTYGILARDTSNPAKNNITVKNCNLTDWAYGLYYSTIENSSVRNITSLNTTISALYMDFSKNITLSNIVLFNNSDGLTIDATSNSTLTNISSFNNTDDGIVLWDDSDNNTFNNITSYLNKGEGIYLRRTLNNTFSNLTLLQNADTGIYIDGSNFTFVSDVVAFNNSYGLLLSGSSNNTLTMLNISNHSSCCGGGITLWPGSHYNLLANISISANSLGGVYLDNSSNNTITNVTAWNNFQYGVYIASGSVNTFLANITSFNNTHSGIFLSENVTKTQIFNSTLSNNRFFGVFILHSRFNNISSSLIQNHSLGQILIRSHTSVAVANSSFNILWNNIFNNTNGAQSIFTQGENYTNYFNVTKVSGTNVITGAFIGGSYYSDYSGTDANGDGFGDTNYVVNGSIMLDSLPLVFHGTPNITINSPPNASTIYGNDVLLNATVLDGTNDYMAVSVYVSNNTKYLNTSLVYTNLSVRNATEILYSLDTLPIQKYPGDGLVLLMHLDNRSEFGENSSTIYDFSHQGMNGSARNGAFWNASGGKFGGGFQLDGVNDVIEIPSSQGNSLLNLTRNFTFSVWFYENGTGSGIGTLVGRRDSVNTQYQLYLGTSGTRTVTMRDSAASGIATAANAYSQNRWQHAVVTVNDSLYVTIYVNGTRAANGTGTFSYFNINTSIGTRWGVYPATAFQFNGSIDEVAIWNRSLSESEVAALYNASYQKYYWRVNASPAGNFENSSFNYEFTLSRPNLSICTNITVPGVYMLNASITNSAFIACMNITSSDVIFDCVGDNNWIDGVQTLGRYGIKAEGTASAPLTNITVKNCNLTQWTAGYRANSTENSTVLNVSVTNDSTGISFGSGMYNSFINITGLHTYQTLYLLSSSHNLIENTTTYNNTDDSIYISSGSNNTLRNINATNASAGIVLAFSNNNVLSNISTSLHAFYGIWVFTSSFNNLSNITASASQRGIYLQTNSSNNTLANIISFNNTQYGVILSRSDNNTLRNITAFNNTQYGVWIFSSSLNNLTSVRAFNSTEGVRFTGNSSNNTVINLTVFSNSLYGLRLSTNSNNNTFINVTSFNNSFYGIYLLSGANGSSFSGINSSQNFWAGVLLSASSNNTFTNITAAHNQYGVWLTRAPVNTFLNITSINNSISGVNAFISPNITLKNVSITRNLGHGGLRITGQALWHSWADIDTANTINGKPIQYYDGVIRACPSNTVLDYNTTYSHLTLVGCDNVTVRMTTDDTILIIATNNSRVEHSVSSNGYSGINLDMSYNNTVLNMTANNHSNYGLGLDWKDERNQIINSTIKDNRVYGIYSDFSKYNNITGSRIENNSVGLYLQSNGTDADLNSSYNRIWDNIVNNTLNGGLNWKTEGINYTNYFNTTKIAGTNVITGAFFGGNYWSDYSGTDVDDDGIGDTNYVINGTLMNDSLPLLLNLAPQIIHLAINPLIAYTNLTLNCSGNYSDEDSNMGNITVTWYNGSAGTTLFSSQTFYNKANGSSASLELRTFRNGLAENASDGFSVSSIGAADARSITTNGSDFWINDRTDDFVYHVRKYENGSIVNFSDGFSLLTAIGAGSSDGITTNGSDFWILDFNDDFVYHFRKYENGSVVNFTDGFKTTLFGADLSFGITTNGSDFWIYDDTDSFIYHIRRYENGSLVNFTDGFKTSLASGGGDGMVTNGSDFWISGAGNFVHHYNASNGIKTNNTDGFDVSAIGSGVQEGLTSFSLSYEPSRWPVPIDFWLLDGAAGDDFVYHIIGESGIQAKGEVWNCTINASDSLGSAGSPNSTTRTVSNLAPNVTQNFPANASTFSNTTIQLNATVLEVDTADTLSVNIYVANNTQYLKTSLVYTNLSVRNATEILYNLTAVPVQKYPGDGLVLLYHFDNQSEFGENGTTVYDYSLQGNNGSVRNSTSAVCGTAGACPVWNASGGKFGGSFQFDGEEDYIEANHNESLNPGTGNWTISLWAYYGNASDALLLEKGFQNEDGFTYYAMRVLQNKSEVTFRSGENALSVSHVVNITLNSWTHVAATWSGSSGSGIKVLKLYIGGVNVSQSSLSGGPYVITNSEPFVIGKANLTGNYYFNGTLDEVAMWNRTLSDTEIASMYSLSAQKYFWRVNASDGTDEVTSFTREFTILSSLSPTVALLTPVNASNVTSNANITFSCNATDDGSLANVSLYGNWSGGWHRVDSNNTWYAWQNSTQYNWNVSFPADFENQSDSFSAGTFGAGNAWDMTTNGTDLWLIDDADNFVYHIRNYANGSTVNFSDGFSTSGFGAATPEGLTTNGSDFWIGDDADDFIYHVNRTGGNCTGTLCEAGFSVSSAGVATLYDVTGNGSDLWVLENADDFMYHFNLTGGNQSDGFSISGFGAADSEGMEWNGSDFWIGDNTDDFMYHVNWTAGVGKATNNSDGFSVGVFGAPGVGGLTMDSLSGTNKIPTQFYSVNSNDDIVYHLASSISGQFIWNCLATDSNSLMNFSTTGNYTFLVNLNQSPKIENIAISPSTAYTNSTLNCSGNYSDADADLGNVTLTWYNGSAGTTLIESKTFYNIQNGSSLSFELRSFRNGIGVNVSDSFDILAVGLIDSPDGITTNGSDLWIVESTADLVYHFKSDGIGGFTNYTDGFSTSGFGAGFSSGIATNGTDFWLADFGDDFIYHVRSYANGSITNFTDGFSMGVFGAADSRGITTNGSDFWIPDITDDFVYHFAPYGNGSGQNFTDGFNISIIGSSNAFGITTNGSDFWLSDNTDNFVYHVNSSAGTGKATNNSDGFKIAGVSGLSDVVIGTPMYDPSRWGVPSDFWMIDLSSYVNHAKGEVAIQGKGETWNCTMNASDSAGNLGNPNSTTNAVTNNINPTIGDVRIYPAVPVTTDTLNCSGRGFDQDLDTLTINFTWYNGSAYYNSSTYSTTNATYVNHTLTPAGIQADNEIWNCTIFVSDASLSSALNSTTVGSDTRKPTVELISPANNFNTNTSNNFTFRCNATDNIGLSNVSLYGNWSGAWHRFSDNNTWYSWNSGNDYYWNVSFPADFQNQSDGFKTSTAGAATPLGTAYNGSDLWVVDNTDKVVYHLKTYSNGSVQNITDGFNLSIHGAANPGGLTFNNSDFWITDDTDNFVYHVNWTSGVAKATNNTDGFSTSGFGAATPYGITYNGSDFWIVDNADDFVYHVRPYSNGSITNFTDGFSTTGFGAGDPRDFTFNGSDFWLADGTDAFVYHFNASGGIATNNSDGFSISPFGASGGWNGIVSNIVPYDSASWNVPTEFWIADTTDDYEYHLKANREGQFIWNCLAYDSTGGFNWSNQGNYTLTVDQTPPSVVLQAPSNGSANSTLVSSLDFIYNASSNDAFGINNCTLYLNGVKNNTNATVNLGSNNSILVLGLASGVYNWTVQCTDYGNNANSTGNYSLTFTFNQIPVIENIAINPSTAYTNSILNCSGNYSDANSDIGNITVTWYNGSAGTNLFSSMTYYNLPNSSQISFELRTFMNGIAENASDGASISGTFVGAGSSGGLAYNGSDFWILDNNDDWAYHVKPYGNGSIQNFSDGFNINDSVVGAEASRGLAYNSTDFWILNNNMFVFHVNKSGYNFTDGFMTSAAGILDPNDIATNGSDFWLADGSDEFIYHIRGYSNGSVVNFSDGFKTDVFGATEMEGLHYNGSDFWGMDQGDDFVYHFRSYANGSTVNFTDGFSVADSGAAGALDIISDIIGAESSRLGVPSQFWVAESSDDFFYHYVGQSGIQYSGETWNCTMNASDSQGSAGAPNSTLRTITSLAPVIPHIAINPATAYTNSTLNCSGNYSDPESTLGNITVTWYNGSAGTALFSRQTYYNLPTGSSASLELRTFMNGLAENGSSGYSVASTIGSSLARGITTNGSDFWIYDQTDVFVYHSKPNETGTGLPYNFTDGFSVTTADGVGAGATTGITTNGTDFWLVDDIDDFVYHVKGNGSGYPINYTDGFSLTVASGVGSGNPTAITTNGSDFWLTDEGDDFVYHVRGYPNGSVVNFTDGFSITAVSGVGAGSSQGITTNGSDFWITDDNDVFVYHVNWTSGAAVATNKTDGFDLDSFGIGSPRDIVSNMRSYGSSEFTIPASFWIVESDDDFAYHLLGESGIQSKGETWNCTINATNSLDVVSAPNSTTRLTNNLAPNVTVNFPPNASSLWNLTLVLNATVHDTDNDLMTVKIYAANNTQNLDTSLVYQNISVRNNTEILYNLTALPVQKYSNDGLVLLMQFDNSSEFGESYRGSGSNGSNVTDLSGNGFNGTVNGSVIYNVSGGKFGGAFVFRKNDSIIRIKDNNNLENWANFTLSAWFYPVSNSSSMNIFNKGFDEYHTVANANGQVGCDFKNDSSTYISAYSNAQNLIKLNQWNHITCTFNGNIGGYYCIYFNGLLDHCEWESYQEVIVTSFDLAIGNRIDAFAPFNGSIDQVAIWRRALSETEVGALFNLSRQKYYWRTNASDGTEETSSWNYEFSNNSVPTTPQTGGFSNGSRNIANNMTFVCENSTDTDGDTIFYTFYVNTTPGSTTVTQNSTATSFFMDTTDGSTYYFRCHAEDNFSGSSANTAEIQFTENTVPGVPNLIMPGPDNSTTNRTLQFNWSQPTDAEGDSVVYQLNVSCFPSCSADTRLQNTTVAGENFTVLTDRLRYFYDDLFYYNWTVRAWDGYEFGSFNGTPNTLKLTSVISLSMLNSTINFGSLNLQETANTTTNNPFPLSIRNDGNSFVHVNMSNDTDAGLLWDSIAGASSYYQFKIGNMTGENGSFNWSGSTTAFTNVPVSNITSINFFNYTDASDESIIDILLTVPDDETSGAKSTVMQFTGYYVREI